MVGERPVERHSRRGLSTPLQLSTGPSAAACSFELATGSWLPDLGRGDRSDQLPPPAQDEVGLVLWGGYVVFWMVTVDSGVAIAIVWWRTGTIVFGSFRLATQPRFGRRRSVGGVFVRPGWTDWRFLDLQRTHRAGAQTGRTLSSRSDALQPPEYR